MGLVYSRQVGSAHRKAVLAFCADRASDDGSGVWPSKGTIARATECGRSTVIRVMAEFEAEGILVRTGKRRGSNGLQPVYRIDLKRVAKLPKVKTETGPEIVDDDQSHAGTSPTAGLVSERDQSRSGTTTSPTAGPDLVPQRDPNHPSTIHQPSLTNVPISDEAVEEPNEAPEEDAPELEGIESVEDARKRREREELAEAVEIYNEAARSTEGWPVAQRFTEARRASLRKRLKEVGGIEGWKIAIEKAKASDFLTGKRPGSNGPFFASFDFLLQAKSFTKLLEGAYDNRTGSYQTARDTGRGTASRNLYAGFERSAARHDRGS